MKVARVSEALGVIAYVQTFYRQQEEEIEARICFKKGAVGRRWHVYCYEICLVRKSRRWRWTIALSL